MFLIARLINPSLRPFPRYFLYFVFSEFRLAMLAFRKLIRKFNGFLVPAFARAEYLRLTIE